MHSRLTILGVASLLFALTLSAASAAPAGSPPTGPFPVSKLIGLHVIGDDDSPLGAVEDVLIAFDGRIVDFIVDLTGEKREGERVRLPWADVSLERDPLQVKLDNAESPFMPYPGPPHGTLGGIKAALLSYLVGAPAKTRLGENVGETVALGANADGQIVDVTLSQGGTDVPLPWGFIEVRAEEATYPTERDIEPVVVVVRPE